MGTLVFVVAAIVSLGLAFGAAYPRFDTQNAAQIATGFGGVVYMVACLGVITAVAALELWPVSRLFWHHTAAFRLGQNETLIVAVAFALVLLLTCAITAAGRRSALRSLA